MTPAPFDRFLAGDDNALSAQQRAGLRAFTANGCAGCHSGALLGGTMTVKFGLVKDYWLETGSAKVDLGRFAASKKEEDKYVFRVPMLRNVAKTAPYFHDGSVDSLERAVRIMASVQLGRKLDDAIRGDRRFPRALTASAGELRAAGQAPTAPAALACYFACCRSATISL